MAEKSRKIIRLREYNYSQNGAYFVTICTHNRELLFGDVGADSISARMVDDVFNRIMAQYDNVSCPKYVVMPNHFHAIIVIEDRTDIESRADIESAPTINLSKIIQEFKRYTTVEYIKLVKMGQVKPFNGKVWQRSFYDHIVRNYDDFLETYKYIENNPYRWKEDSLYKD